MCYQSHNWSIFHHPCHKIFSLALLGILQVIQLKHNFSWRLKNKCSISECLKFIEVKSNALFLSTFGVKIDVLNKRKRVSRMCENAYLSIKNPKASRAPRRRMHASLARLRFATSATFGLRSWGPPPWPNPGSAPGLTCTWIFYRWCSSGKFNDNSQQKQFIAHSHLENPFWFSFSKIQTIKARMPTMRRLIVL